MPFESPAQETPLCPLFGECGGCQYQDIPYADELQLKEEGLRAMLTQGLGLAADVFQQILPSPQPYHYRSRMDLKLLRIRDGRIFMGFSPMKGNFVVEATACPIAMSAISEFIPQLRREAAAALRPKYRNANLVVKTGDDGRVLWGGIGRRSLRVEEDAYLWTMIRGRRIFFSLDTFFQANLAILPAVFDLLYGLDIFGPDVCFFDLYGGVGLFGIGLYDAVGRVVLLEENIHAVKLARHNAAFNHLERFEIFTGRMEDSFACLEDTPHSGRKVVMVDPPRKGLGPAVSARLAGMSFGALIYLSCGPEALVEDLRVLMQGGWTVFSVTPLDFFPRTRHIETLVILKRSPCKTSFRWFSADTVIPEREDPHWAEGPDQG